jgi:hypothetical protein
MLKTIDILLGVTVVMLIVSMCITMLTQAVGHLRETAGTRLLEGLSDLLQQIDPSLSRTIASGIATALLRHPLVNDGAKRLGTTIHREELTTLLLNLGSGNIPESLKTQVSTDVQAAITKILTDHGITNPQQTLANVRSVALHLERASPALATDVRHSIALMQEVSEGLIGKVNGWFDQTMDRVSSRFTTSARQATFICSILVAFALQLDVVGLVNRLSVDPELRKALVTEATEIANSPRSANETDAARQAETQMQTLATMTGQSRQDLQDLVQIGVVTLPGRQWLNNWGNGSLCQAGNWITTKIAGPPPANAPPTPATPEPCRPKVNLLGVILSALMLSLGAPFWYNVMKNLIGLRSAIAGKDDSQRRARETSQAAVAVSETSSVVVATTPAQAAQSLAGERGILG